MSLVVSGMLGLLVLGAGDPRTPNVEITPVLHQGDPAPGIPGATMVWFFTPHIDGEGNVMIKALYQNAGEPFSRVGIWHGPPGALQLIAYEGMQAPDLADGVILSSIRFSMLAENGWMAIPSLLIGPGIVEGSNDLAVFVGPPGDIRKVLQGGDPAPGLEPGTIIDVTDSFGLLASLSDNATIRTQAYLSGPDVNETNDRVVYVGPRDNLQPIWREGMEAPGTEQGVTFAWADLMVCNDAAHIAFRGGLTGDSIDDSNDVGRWSGGAGNLSLVTRAGDQAPGFPEDITLAVAGGGLTTINAHGDTTELTLLQGPGITEDNDLILYAGQPGDLQIMRREGDSAPEAGEEVEIANLGNHFISNTGEILYSARYSGPGIDATNERGLYFGPFENAELTLRQGAPAPLLPVGTVLSFLAIAPALAAMNDVGDVVTATEMVGPGVTETNNVAVWFRDRVRSKWIPLLRDGSIVDGEIVTIQGASDLSTSYWNKTGGSDAHPQSLDDSGRLVIGIDFEDQSGGVFILRVRWFGDADGDSDVDFADFGVFQNCFGDQAQDGPPCGNFDFDSDGQVDLSDYEALLGAATGPY